MGSWKLICLPALGSVLIAMALYGDFSLVAVAYMVGIGGFMYGLWIGIIYSIERVFRYTQGAEPDSETTDSILDRLF